MKQSCGNSVGLKLENVTVEDHKTPLQTKKMSFPTMQTVNFINNKATS